jgi:hypothetical protein
MLPLSINPENAVHMAFLDTLALSAKCFVSALAVLKPPQEGLKPSPEGFVHFLEVIFFQ